MRMRHGINPLPCPSRWFLLRLKRPLFLSLLLHLSNDGLPFFTAQVERFSLSNGDKRVLEKAVCRILSGERPFITMIWIIAFQENSDVRILMRQWSKQRFPCAMSCAIPLDLSRAIAPKVDCLIYPSFGNAFTAGSNAVTNPRKNHATTRNACFL